MIFLSQPRFQCGFKIRLFFWWILVGCFPDIVTYTQWNSYFEAFGPGWIVIIQFADRIAKRQFFVEKLLTIIFQSASLQGQGVNTPNSSTVRPWKSDNWKTICTFLLRDSVFFSTAANSPYLGFFCSRYPTWGSDGKLYSPWTDGRVKVPYLKGEKGAAGGSGGRLFPFSFDATKNWAFF